MTFTQRLSISVYYKGQYSLVLIGINSHIDHLIRTINMFYMPIILLLSSVNAQNYYPQRQNSYINNFNQRPSYPTWNQGIQQSKLTY
jgi:hypothetical protein